MSVGDMSVWVQHSGPRNGTYSGVGTIVLPQELLYSKLSCYTSGQHF